MENLRYRPQAYTESITGDYGIECFYTEIGKPAAILYAGRSKKPIFHFSFRTVEQMHDYINEKIGNITTDMQSNEERKNKAKDFQAQMKASDHFKVGDIIVNSWGWEQTNIEFYQVTEVKNKKIKVQEIYQHTVEGSEYSHGMECNVMPSIDRFIETEKPFLLSLKMDAKGNCLICNPKSYYYFYKWEGGEMYKSWYA